MNVVDHQKSKIVATVGPASRTFEMLLGLVRAGVNVFRLNFSHGEHEEHQEVIDNIHRINEEFGLHIGILADLQGPKIRIGKIENDEFEIRKDQEITLTTEECLGTPEKVTINYNNFPRDVKKGERLLLDDGKVVCEVISTDELNEVRVKVLFGSVLRSRKGVNLPETKLSIPSLTEKDLRDLDYILTQDVHWIALSFVRNPEDIEDLKARIEAKGHPAQIMAKIEKPEAIDKLEKIIEESDGVMIARGDLGIEVPMEKLPAMQKRIVQLCIEHAKPVIVATQLMDSMIKNPSPTRAEITDVANAVLDGTDAVMLSAETAVGDHPIKVVEAMNKIIAEAEQHYRWHYDRPFADPTSPTFLSDTICINAAKIADETGAKGIVGLTTSGYTAFHTSRYRPNCNIFIFSDRDFILKTLSMVWGVRCFHYDKYTSTDETIYDVIDILKDENLVHQGDRVINTGAMPLAARLRTNFLKITIVD